MPLNQSGGPSPVPYGADVSHSHAITVLVPPSQDWFSMPSSPMHSLAQRGLLGCTTDREESMSMPKRLLVCGLLVLTLSSAAPGAAGDEVHVMVSGAFTAAYKVLVAEWERSTGHKVVTVSGA